MRISFTWAFMCIASLSLAQNINYGNNPAAGHYLAMADSTKIYYEAYGQGRPVVLLHGALYGDIGEYSRLIPVLSKRFKVIAVDLRGHAKSYIGHRPFTYDIFVDDALAVIRHVTTDSVILIGFSTGAVTALFLSLAHPELVRRLVYAGGNFSTADMEPGVHDALAAATGASIEQENPDFVKKRRELMPEPNRWDDFVAYLRNAWITQPAVDSAQLQQLKCPVLIAGGDRDQVNGAQSFFKQYGLMPNASLAIIPNSDHIIFARRPDLMERLIMEFIQ